MFIKIVLKLFAIILLSSSVFAAENVVDVSGSWTGVVELANGQELPFGITLNQNGSQLSGFMDGIGGPDVTIMNPRLEDNILYYSSVRPINGEDVAFDYIAVISGDYMNITIIRVGATGPNSVLSTMTQRQTQRQ
jgi:hypothetical protein